MTKSNEIFSCIILTIVFHLAHSFLFFINTSSTYKRQVIQHSEVDVFQAVKTVRRHRPQLVDNMVCKDFFALEQY